MAHRVDEKRALELIANFWQEIFGNDVPNPMHPPVKWAGMPYWIDQPWRFLDIRPDFLYSDQYGDNLKPEEIHPLFYFSGLSTDSCTFFYKGDIFYLLLTTGSP